MPTLNATYDYANSRVRLQLVSALANETTCLMEVELSPGVWGGVRRGDVAITSNQSAPVWDYEFPTKISGTRLVNYRCRILNTGSFYYTSVSVWLDHVAWIKFPGYPSLNHTPRIIGMSEITRDGRSSRVQRMAASAPSHIGNFMDARKFSITVRYDNWADYSAADTALATGSVVFLHAPEDELGLPQVYAIVGSVSAENGPKHFSGVKYVTIDLEEVSRPGYGYGGFSGTWQTILTNNATWAALLAAKATWSDVMDTTGSPTDVIVG